MPRDRRRLSRPADEAFAARVPPAQAEEMIALVRNSVGELAVANAPCTWTSEASVAPGAEAPRDEAPRLEAQPAAAAPKPARGLPNDPLRIARFVHRFPTELLPAWAPHPASRITDESCEAFKGAPDDQ